MKKEAVASGNKLFWPKTFFFSSLSQFLISFLLLFFQQCSFIQYIAEILIDIFRI